jgi:small subunit ribosomal protein S1
MRVNDQISTQDEKHPIEEKEAIEVTENTASEQTSQPKEKAEEEKPVIEATEDKETSEEEEDTGSTSEETKEKESDTEKEAETSEQDLSEAEESESQEKIEAEKKEDESLKSDDEQPEENSNRQEMLNLLDEHFSRFKPGEIVEGTVVNVDERNVLVDIGYKSEGAVSIKDFPTASPPEKNDKIKVYIESAENGSGRLKLSKKKADFYSNLPELEKLKEDNETVTGILRRRVKGGMIVEIDNLEAFLPGSHISTKPIPNLDQFIGKEYEFKILTIDKDRRNIIVSRKKVLEEDQKRKLDELKDKLVEGAELDGEVRNITDYGAFVDLGGIDGLLHITDMSWGHLNHPSDMLSIGDKLKVKVLNFDKDENKVSLGLKQLVPHPWENIEAKYPEGSIVTGKVVNLTSYGAFIELEPGVEGLVHVTELSWTKRVKHAKKVLKKGETVKAIVLSTSKEDKRISLGIKQMEPNPWLTIDELHPEGSIVEGPVKSITPFGIFIEIEKDIEGLIHISDISWTKRIYHPKEMFKRGDMVKAKVLSIDKTLHRIALGIKQLSPDPWEKLDEKLPINSELTAKISKIIAKGVLVDIPVNETIVEGFVPLSHLAIPGLRRASAAFKLGEELPLKVIELDLENRRLILSVKAYFFRKEEDELKEFIRSHEERMQASYQKKKEQEKARKEEKKKEEAKTTAETESPKPEEAAKVEETETAPAASESVSEEEAPKPAESTSEEKTAEKVEPTDASEEEPKEEEEAKDKPEAEAEEKSEPEDLPKEDPVETETQKDPIE